MARCILLAVVLIVVSSTHPARGEDTAETKRLKDRIELLEGKLKNSDKEIELLRKELKLSKAGEEKASKDDGFQVGTKLSGQYIFNRIRCYAVDGFCTLLADRAVTVAPTIRPVSARFGGAAASTA